MSAPEKRSLRERLRPKERKPAVRWLLTVLLLAAAVLGLHMLLQMIGTLDFSRGRFSSYLHVPKIYLLNLLPVALLVAFTYFATNRAWLGFLIPSVLLFIMDFVNYFKVTLRGDPFVAEDFLNIGEGAGIIGQYTLHFPAMFFVGIALIAAGTIVLHRWARGRMPKKRWWLRVLALVLIVLLGFGAWELWYGNTDLYDSMMEANTSLFNDQILDMLYNMHLTFLVPLADQPLYPSAYVIAVFSIISAELQKVYIALGHIVFDSFLIAWSGSLIATQKGFLLHFGFQKFLPRSPEQSPGNVEVTVSIACQLKVQYAADMMPVP